MCFLERAACSKAFKLQQVFGLVEQKLIDPQLLQNCMKAAWPVGVRT
jgi:hypothetical protein